MRVLDRKVLRELVASKGLLLAITSLIAVGVMCFIYMRSAYNNLNLAKAEYYDQCRMADFWIDVKKVPLAELDLLSALPGVSEIRPRIQSYATVDLDRTHEPLNGMVLSLPDRRAKVVNDIVLMRGSYFTVCSLIKFLYLKPEITGSPLLGEHTDEVLAELGYSKDQIADLREAKAV